MEPRKMTKLYFETVRGQLIPVELIATVPEIAPGAASHANINRVTLRVKRTTGAYKAGELIETFPHHAVNKTRVIAGRQYVAPAWLPDYLPDAG